MDLDYRLEQAFNAELSQRLLIRYFCEKGFNENFDKKVYPPMLQDIVESIPEFEGKIEVVPHAIEIDPQTGFAKIGWNLFVLGNQRMYLGESEHSDSKELARQLESGQVAIEESQIKSRMERTARDIVGFITHILGKNEAGMIRTGAEQPKQLRPLGHSAASSMFERPKTIRPEGSQQF